MLYIGMLGQFIARLIQLNRPGGSHFNVIGIVTITVEQGKVYPTFSGFFGRWVFFEFLRGLSYIFINIPIFITALLTYLFPYWNHIIFHFLFNDLIVKKILKEEIGDSLRERIFLNLKAFSDKWEYKIARLTGTSIMNIKFILMFLAILIMMNRLHYISIWT